MNNLTEARARIDSARWNFDRAKADWRDKKEAATLAQAAFTAERQERAAVISRGGPRPLAGFVPPKSAAELAADAAQSAFNAAELLMNSAQRALAAAEASLLAQENRILNRVRDQLAREYRQLQLEGASDEVLAARLAELRVLCPPATAVRINQAFALSALTREVLDEQPDVLHLHTPVNVLRGEASGGYEQRRAQILSEFETESPSPLEAA
jgi:hypothetical protein